MWVGVQRDFFVFQCSRLLQSALLVYQTGGLLVFPQDMVQQTSIIMPKLAARLRILQGNKNC
jgi:hypothetical protein